jgi:hypothetical protein
VLSSLQDFQAKPLYAFLICPYVLHAPHFLSFSLCVRDQVSHPWNATGCLFSPLRFQITDRKTKDPCLLDSKHVSNINLIVLSSWMQFWFLSHSHEIFRIFKEFISDFYNDFVS